MGRNIWVSLHVLTNESWNMTVSYIFKGALILDGQLVGKHMSIWWHSLDIAGRLYLCIPCHYFIII